MVQVHRLYKCRTAAESIQREV